MAYPKLRAAGAKAAAKETKEVEVGAPAGLEVGDLEILIAGTTTATVAEISAKGGGAWTLLGSLPVDVASGERLTIWTRERAEGDGNPKVKCTTSDHIVACRLAVQKGTFDPEEPIEGFKASTETTSDTSFAWTPGNETGGAERLCVVVVTSGVDSNTGQAGTNTANTSLTEITNPLLEYQTAEGNGGGFWVATGQREKAGTFGEWTQTMVSATPKVYASFAIKPLESENVEGAAALTGTGSLTAKGTRGRYAASGLTGTGSLTASGTRGRYGKAALTGVGTLNASGTRGRYGKASLSGTGSLTAVGTVTKVSSVKVDAVSSSEVGTGKLTIKHNAGKDVKGVLVLVVENGVAGVATDDVKEVTIDGTPVPELTESPLLHTVGTEDGNVHAFFLDTNISNAEHTIEVIRKEGGLFSARAVAYTISSTYPHVEVAAESKKDSSGANPAATLVGFDEEVGGLAFGALHSGQDSLASVAAGSGFTEDFGIDFGSQTGFWTHSAEGVFTEEKIVDWVATAEEYGVFAVGIQGIPAKTVEGKAALTGVGSLSAKGFRGRYGKAALTGTGSLTAKGESFTLGKERGQEVFPDQRPRQVRYGAVLEMPNGRHITIGPDEAEARDVPIQAGWDTELPGGFGPGTITLPIPEGIVATEARLFMGVRIYDGDTGRGLYEGRITSASIAGSTVTVQTEGWAKHLEDDGTASMIFYDRDFSKWTGSQSVKRQIELVEAGYTNLNTAAVKSDIEAPALECQFSATWGANPALPRAEGWYDAGAGNKIAEIDYAWKRGTYVDSAGNNWIWEIIASENDYIGASSNDPSGNLQAAGPASDTLETTEGDKRYAVVKLQNTGESSVLADPEGTQYSLFWTLLAVAGDHTVPLEGEVEAPDVGRTMLGSNVASYVVSTWAPLLDFSTGNNGSIETTTFGIPHLAYPEHTTARTMIEELSLLGGSTFYPLDWGVYDNKRFFMRTPGRYGRTWRVRKEDASEDSNSGPDASARLNGVVVTYDDGTGKKFSVGPNGSGCDFETDLLEDDDPTNPANFDGARHWKAYDAEITSQDGAILIGQMILNNANTIQWRGDVTIKGEAVEDSGIRFPVGMVRAGDIIVVEDDIDTRPRRIVNTSVDGQTVKASCGADPDKFDVLLARNRIVLVGRL